MRKTMSSKQLAANRRNAQQSTGPRTAQGRAVSKMNAVKHGILSKEVVVRGLRLKESPREFKALHQRFVESLQPVGPLEEMLVDQIVTAHWRLRRALTAESGEIALSVEEGAWQRACLPHPRVLWAQWEALGDPLPVMQDSALGNRLIERWLGDLQAAVEREGELTASAIQEAFAGRTNSLSQRLEELRLQLAAKPAGTDPAAWREQNKQEALAFLRRELDTVARRRAQCEQRERHAETARQAAAVLPAAATLEKILRYETKLERQLFRAMNQLERLQRMRQGEAIPAPLTMEVAERA